MRLVLNKLIAHGADPHSRGHKPIPGATLGDIWACHKAIVQATEIVATILVRAHGSPGVPTPQYDVLEGWDMPFAPPSSFDQLHEDWIAVNQSRGEWGNEAHREL